MTTEEMQRIAATHPQVPIPWFRKLEGKELSDAEHPYATVVRNGTCVFQDKTNLCKIYDVRPQYCRDFPIEDGKTAPHYQRLCVLFHEQWSAQSALKKNLVKREGQKLAEKFNKIEKSIDF